MGPAYLILAGVALLVGLPLLVGAVWVATWMRRTSRSGALKTYFGVAISGALSFLAFFGAIAALIAIAATEKRRPDYFENHPALPLVMIALGLLTLFAGFACMLFSAWTIWRLVQAPPAQPLRTTTAA
jgi:cytochrome bd-type quinol oxidase subunit 2